MKKEGFILLVMSLLAFPFVQAQKIGPQSSIAFIIKNAGIKVDGRFDGPGGTVRFDAKEPAKSSFDVYIDAKTIYTGNSSRDGHLRKKEYFDVETYPKINFKSKKTEATKTGYLVTGLLSLKGKTKEISIPFSYSEKNSEGLLTGSFVMNRLDFGVGESSWILADDVTIILNVKLLNP